MGPAKGKDFATSLGLELVSPDELPGDLDLRAVARVNAEVRSDSRTGAMNWSWISLSTARNTPASRPATCSAPEPWAAAASSSTATAAGCGRAMRWSSR